MKQPKIRPGGVRQTYKLTPATCHPDKPMQARGLCKNCYDRWLKDRNPEYRKRQLRNCEVWHEQHPGGRAKNRSWPTKADAARKRNSQMYERFGLTHDDYDILLAKHNGACWICGRLAPAKRRLSVDHDHDTGEIRGLLCFRCNFGLSYFAESIPITRKALEYLVNGPKVHAEISAIVDQRILEHEAEVRDRMNRIKQIAEKEINNRESYRGGVP